MTKYWRITYLDAESKRRHVWATNYIDGPAPRRVVTFFIVNREGDEYDPRRLVIASPADILKAQPAVLSKTYAMLEVTRER